MVLGQLDSHMWKKKKKNLDTDFISSIKINSKWIMNINVKYKTIKLPDYIENLDDLRYVMHC